MIKNDFLRNLSDQVYLGWDTETEGLNHVRSRPWQISYALFKNGSVLEIDGEPQVFDRYIYWEDINVSGDAAEITGFDKDDYMERAIDPDKVLEEFNEYLYDSEIINFGHNILGFDIYMHKVLSTESGVDHDWNYLTNSLDTLCLARGYKSNEKPDFDNFLAWQFRMLKKRSRGNKLEELGKEFDIEFDKSKLHSAVEDVKLNAKVMKHFLNIYDI